MFTRFNLGKFIMEVFDYSHISIKTGVAPRATRDCEAAEPLHRLGR